MLLSVRSSASGRLLDHVRVVQLRHDDGGRLGVGAREEEVLRRQVPVRDSLVVCVVERLAQLYKKRLWRNSSSLFYPILPFSSLSLFFQKHCKVC